MVTNCQVCGNPIFGHRDMGFNKDGSINADYCSNCYKFGYFVEGGQNQSVLSNSILLPLIGGSVSTYGGDNTQSPTAIAPVFLGLDDKKPNFSD